MKQSTITNMKQSIQHVNKVLYMVTDGELEDTEYTLEELITIQQDYAKLLDKIHK